MGEGAFLAPYAGQSAPELLALQGHFRTDSIVLAFEAALMEKAAAAIGEEDAEREDRLDACDTEYYATASDLAGPLLTFITAHVDQITIPG